MISLPENFKIVSATAGAVTTNGGITCDYVSLKNYHKAWIVAHFRQAVSHTTTLQPQVATAVAPTGAASITFSAKWWKNADISTTDTLTAATAATSMACTAGATHQLIIVEIDPADMVAQGSTYDVLGCTVSDSSQATNFVSVLYILEPRFAQATPPSAILD